MPWSSVLIIGIIYDVLSGLTLGISCFSLLLVRYIIIKSLFKFDGSGNLYTFIYTILGLFIWLIIIVIFRSLIQLQFFNYMDVVYQYLLSIFTNNNQSLNFLVCRSCRFVGF